MAFLLLSSLSASAQLGNPEALEELIRKSGGSLSSLGRIESMSPDKLGIAEQSKSSFVTIYSGFLSNYSTVKQDYRQFRAVPVFAAIRYRDVVLGNGLPLASKADNEPNNSLYVAFALLTGAGVDYDLIGNREHLQSLALSYGLTTQHIQNGIWETLTREWSEILGLIVTMIDANVASAGSADKGRFIRNTIHPYFTLLSRGYSVPENIEKRIFAAFDKAFPAENGKTNFLMEYVAALKGHLEGAPMQGKFDIDLNDRLKAHGFHLTIGTNQCVSYELMKYRIPIGTAGIGEVLLKKRCGVALLGTDIGMATYEAPDVTLTWDHLTDIANDISIIVHTDSLPMSYRAGADTLWKDIGYTMTAIEANEIYRAGIRRQFKGNTQHEILKRMVRQVTTHELKHKWDELKNPAKEWMNVDFEISARLAEAIYGGCSLQSLFGFINRLQNYYVNINHPQVRAKLKPLIIAGWELARSVRNAENAESQIVRKLTSLYQNYTTLRGRRLPSISEFKTHIVDGPLKELPMLEL